MSFPHASDDAPNGPGHARDRFYLDMAARAALRGCGNVEPNPAVGCVLVREGRVLAIGHHARFGGPHAEAAALASCAASGTDARGATAYVTLEPCNHQGKTPACAEALLRAGVGEVVIARADPHPRAAGGADTLRAGGVHVRVSGASCAALAVGAPFVKRVRTGLPWVIAKWAQTLDGAIATRSGDSKWISCPRSRRAVHRLRARADAIVTGAGTVLADDPMLTARGVAVRRVAARVVIDAELRLPLDSALVRSAGSAPVAVWCAPQAAHTERADQLRGLGVEVVGRLEHDRGGAERCDLAPMLRWLCETRDATNVLVEAGPGLVGSLFAQGRVDEVRAYIAPRVLGDPSARRAVALGAGDSIARAASMQPLLVRTSGVDTEVRYLLGSSGRGEPSADASVPPEPAASRSSASSAGQG